MKRISMQGVTYKLSRRILFSLITLELIALGSVYTAQTNPLALAAPNEVQSVSLEGRSWVDGDGSLIFRSNGTVQAAPFAGSPYLIGTVHTNTGSLPFELDLTPASAVRQLPGDWSKVMQIALNAPGSLPRLPTPHCDNETTPHGPVGVSGNGTATVFLSIDDGDSDLCGPLQLGGFTSLTVTGNVPTSTPTPTPSASPSPTPTASPTPSATPSPTPSTTVTPTPTLIPPPFFNPECSDGFDNDGDGKIDLADPGCSSPFDDDESNDFEDNQDFIFVNVNKNSNTVEVNVSSKNVNNNENHNTNSNDSDNDVTVTTGDVRVDTGNVHQTVSHND